MSEISHVTMGWSGYPLISENEAKIFMQPQTNSIWCLELNGRLISANPMALWLWGLLKLDDTLFSIFDLLNIHLFDIYRQNFSRIPIELAENRDFFTKQAFITKRVVGEYPTVASPYTFFKNAMLASPRHRAIYEQATSSNNVGEYTLKISHPDLHNPGQLLEFRVLVNAISQNGVITGNIARYLPSGETTQRIKPIFQRVDARYGIIPYLLVPEQGRQEATSESSFVGEAVTEGGNIQAFFRERDALLDTDKGLRETATEGQFGSFNRFDPDDSDTNDPWNALLELIEMTHEPSKESEYAMTGAIEEQKTRPLPSPTNEFDPVAEWSLLLELIEDTQIATGVDDNLKTTDSIDHNFIWDEWER